MLFFQPYRDLGSFLKRIAISRHGKLVQNIP